MHKMSAIHGKKIYAGNSEFLGVAKDILIDPTEGVVKFLIKADVQSILGREDAEAKQFIKDNFISFSRIKAIGEVILVD